MPDKTYGAHSNSIVHHAIQLKGFVEHPVHGVGFMGDNLVSGGYEVYFQQPDNKLRSEKAKKMNHRYGPLEWRDGFRTGRDKNKAKLGCAMIASWVYPCRSCPIMPVDIDGKVEDAKVYMAEMFKHYARPRCGTVFIDTMYSKETGERSYQRLYLRDWKTRYEEFSSVAKALDEVVGGCCRSCILQFLDDDGNPVAGVFLPNQWRKEALTGEEVAVDLLTRISYKGRVTPASVLRLQTPVRLLPLADYELSTRGNLPVKAEEWFSAISEAGRRYLICRTTICSVSEVTEDGRIFINDMWPFLKDTKNPPLDFDNKNDRPGFYPEFQNMAPSLHRAPLREWLPRLGAVALKTEAPDWPSLSGQAKAEITKLGRPPCKP